MMKRTVQGFLLLLFLSNLLGCANLSNVQSQGNLKHIVLVWFKEDVSPEYRAMVETKTRALTAIPGVLSIETGQAVKSPRPMVDDSFDLGVVMEFAGAEEMNAYVDHPDHKAFLKQHIQGKVSKVLIFDIH